jgi:magnesium-transporting ATPase (P-type)
MMSRHVLTRRIACRVLRDGGYAVISVKDVVPGDVVVLKPGSVNCDMIVLKADRILVDESALTGEATPMLKVEVDADIRDTAYNQAHHKSFTISAGTEILEVGEDGKDLGLVMTTGSFTTKGQLLTEVLSYQRHKFKFDDEVKLVVFTLVIEAIFLVSMVFYFLDDQWVYAWFYGKYAMIVFSLRTTR